jgi:tetratricopeptide (TPR) repeat protein
MKMRKGAWLDNGWVSTFLIAGVAIGALVSLYAVDKQRQTLAKAAELSYLPKGQYLRVAAIGYRHLVADLLWLKAVQGLSGREQTREGYLGAYHAVDVLTDLDPHFVHAYQYTGTILAIIAGMPHESVAVLKKGVESNPAAWQLAFFLGYDYYYELGDPGSASEYFKKAAMEPGAPTWLAGLAARMAVEANDPAAGLEFLQHLYLQTKDENVKHGLAQRIREVTAERDIRILEQAVAVYHSRFSSFPTSLDGLVKAGIIRGIPQDPFGGQYELAADGAVRSQGLRERFRVHRHR